MVFDNITYIKYQIHHNLYHIFNLILCKLFIIWNQKRWPKRKDVANSLKPKCLHEVLKKVIKIWDICLYNYYNMLISSCWAFWFERILHVIYEYVSSPVTLTNYIFLQFEIILQSGHPPPPSSLLYSGLPPPPSYHTDLPGKTCQS